MSPDQFAPRNRRRFVRQSASVLLGMALVGRGLPGPQRVRAAERPSLVPIDPTSTPLRPLRIGDRLDELDELFDAQQGIFGVMVIDGAGDLRYSRNATLPFVAASLFKLVLAAEVLAKTTSAQIPINTSLPLLPEYFAIDLPGPDSVYSWDSVGTEISIDEALWATLAVSSNVAAMTLLTLTSKKELNRRAASLGMVSTQYFANVDDLAAWRVIESSAIVQPQFSEALAIVEEEAAGWTVNVTSPADIAMFFSALVKQEVVSPTVSRSLLDLLTGQLIADRIPSALPAGTTIAHKTGNLLGIVHDAGAIFSVDGPVILVAMSEGVADEKMATWVIQEATRLTYDALIAFDGPRGRLETQV